MTATSAQVAEAATAAGRASRIENGGTVAREAQPGFLEWVTRLVHTHRGRLYGLARREGLREEDSLDCVQDAFHTFLFEEVEAVRAHGHRAMLLRAHHEEAHARVVAQRGPGHFPQRADAAAVRLPKRTRRCAHIQRVHLCAHAISDPGRGQLNVSSGRVEEWKSARSGPSILPLFHSSIPPGLARLR